MSVWAALGWSLFVYPVATFLQLVVVVLELEYRESRSRYPHLIRGVGEPIALMFAALLTFAEVVWTMELVNA